MTTVDVTAATGDDVAAVTEFWVALAREQRRHGSHLHAAENRQQARDLVAQYVHADGVGVARADGQPVGFVMFHVETGFFETDADRGVVENVYVVPDARGEGVGSALLDYAESALADRGADVLAVEALWDNEDARRLYERRGYEPHRVTFERGVESGDGGGESDGNDETGESNASDRNGETDGSKGGDRNDERAEKAGSDESDADSSDGA